MRPWCSWFCPMPSIYAVVFGQSLSLERLRTLDALNGLHLGSSVALALTLITVSVLVIVTICRHGRVPHPWLFWPVIVFLLCIGVVHAADAVLFWQPRSDTAGSLRLLATAVAVVTVITILPQLPKALALPSLADVNARLMAEIEERKRVELEFRHTQELLKAANSALRQISQTDPLTQLPNRRALDDRLADEVARAARYPAPLSVLMLDVDHFKGFNDTFGHPAGDEVLKKVANILRSCVRETDLIARYGGEEFVVVLPNTATDEAGVVAERCRGAVAGAEWPHRGVTVSVGAATAEAGKVPGAGVLLQAADQALYRAKQSGRNRVEHAAPPATA